MLFLRSLSLLLANLMVAIPYVISQDLSGLPPCALTCLQSAYNTINKACAQTDFSCLCKNSDFVQASGSCYKSSCPADQLSKAVAFGSQTCAQVGVQLATNATANAVAGVANSAANAANNVAGAANRVANSTGANSPVINDGAASRNSQNSGANLAALPIDTFRVVIIASAMASLVMLC